MNDHNLSRQHGNSNNQLSKYDDHSDLGSLDDDSMDGNKKVGKWTAEEDELLRHYVPYYGEKQWRKIAENIPGRSSIQCLHRWTKILKPGLVKGPWTTEEDQKLIAWVKAEGPTKWAQASNFITGRSGKQCRERWFNNLCPGVKKGNWAKEEDELIFELYQKYGSSWSKIARFIPGRTENAIKNRFYSTLRKLATDKKKPREDGEASSGTNKEKTYTQENEAPSFNPARSNANEGTDPASNTLYKLLQEKATVTKEEEAAAAEVIDKGPQKKVKRPEQSISGKVGGSTTADDRTSHAFNINGEKLVITRDSKVTDKAIQDAAAKLAHAEIEDTDIAFEKFLVSLDFSIKPDFLSREFDRTREIDDISQFEKLQQKILSFCQNNIGDLTEAFKTVTSSNINPSQQPRYKQTSASKIPDVKVPTQKNRDAGDFMSPARDDFAPSPKIQTPTPGNKSFGKYSPKGGTAFNFYGSTQKKSQTSESGKSQLKHEDRATQILLELSKRAQNTQYGRLFSNLASIDLSNTTNVNKFVINLVDSIRNIPQDNSADNQKRMTFLFQQLYSLEALLINTRNELMKNESQAKQKKPSGAPKEHEYGLGTDQEIMQQQHAHDEEDDDDDDRILPAPSQMERKKVDDGDKGDMTQDQINQLKDLEELESPDLSEGGKKKDDHNKIVEEKKDEPKAVEEKNPSAKKEKEAEPPKKDETKVTQEEPKASEMKPEEQKDEGKGATPDKGEKKKEEGEKKEEAEEEEQPSIMMGGKKVPISKEQLQLLLSTTGMSLNDFLGSNK